MNEYLYVELRKILRAYHNTKQCKFCLESSASVAFHIETNHFIYRANTMAGFHVKCNTGVKWINQICIRTETEWVYL